MSRRSWLLVSLAALALVMLAGRLASGVYSEWTWYDAMGALPLYRSKLTHEAVMLSCTALAGFALAFARWAIKRRCGLATTAPISGQRAMRASVLQDVLPFADGFGMEVGMTIDAVRAGYRVAEVELDLSHRASSRNPAGFAHRARQLVDFVRAYRARR